MSISPDRQTYRELVAQVAERAKAILPAAVNGRVEAAVKLVLVQDVEPQADGSILVGSSSDSLKQYRLEGHRCTCQDFVHGQAPEGWCQHRIAAGIAKRVGELVPALQPTQEAPVPPAAPALPEAPASVNVRITVAGRDIQWTLRDTDETRLAARLDALLARYPVEMASPSAAASTPPPTCKFHGAMKASSKAPGSFYCTKKLHDGSYCGERFPEKDGAQ